VTEEPELMTLRGAAARTVTNMDASLTVPTATSVRSLPVKLLIDNRIVINSHLSRARGGKVSFTHLIGFALVRALRALPEMNVGFDVIDGKPTVVRPAHINLGLAIDLPKPDGTRQLLVPSIKAAEDMNFAAFWSAYEDVVRRARDGKLTLEDFQGTTVTLTNPGTIGTNHSVPRLMKGQGAIIGVGSMEYPPEFQGASERTIAEMAISKMMTLTSTYDHRVIQGAQSGEFLRTVHQLLLGEDGFYDEIFSSLRIPYEPVRWARDISVNHDDEVHKQARVLELIHAYRVRGHMMADTDPLEYQQRSHPDLDVLSHGLTLWDLEREFATGSFGGSRRFMKLRDILGVLRDSYCRTTGIEYMHIQDPEQRRWIQERIERPHTKTPREEQLRSCTSSTRRRRSRRSCRRSSSAEALQPRGRRDHDPAADEIVDAAAQNELEEVTIGMAHRAGSTCWSTSSARASARCSASSRATSTLGPCRARRREVPPRRRRASSAARRATRSRCRWREPLAPGDRRPDPRGHRRAKQDLLNRGSTSRCCRCCCTATPRSPARAWWPRPSTCRSCVATARRHGAPGGQQPGRVHHLPCRIPLVAVLHRRRPDGAGADLPRQRRRPRGLHPGGPAGLRVPPDVQQGRRHRPRVLPPPRAQRGRRPQLHPAADVRPHRGQALGAQALHRGAGGPWRHHRGRGGVGTA
jgi:hypothetical protein